MDTIKKRDKIIELLKQGKKSGEIADEVGTSSQYISMLRKDARKEASREECIHYWVLGRTDIGVCKKCGITRDFTPKEEPKLSWKYKQNKAKEELGIE